MLKKINHPVNQSTKETKSSKIQNIHHTRVKHSSPPCIMGTVTLTSWTVEAADVVVCVPRAVPAHNVWLCSAPVGAPGPNP